MTEQRLEFVQKALVGRASGVRFFSDLCEEYGISRRVGYKWLRRFLEGGQTGLEDASRAAHRHPNEVAAEIQEELLRIKSRFPRYGAEKARDILRYEKPQWRAPAVSTIGELFKRHGLTASRKRRLGVAGTATLTAGEDVNQVWSADYKGWFRTGDGQRCEPLTIMDSHSRYLLRCQLVPDTSYEVARRIFQACFLEYGLPGVIRTDNGAPFASLGLSGLTRLSVWWVKLGIRPERIRPGRPQQNGRHERMHKTLKELAASPPASSWRMQQRRLDEFRREYNAIRPHHSLAGQRPAWVYQPSPRPYPRRVLSPEYGPGIRVVRVCGGGQFRWRGQKVFVGHALAGEPIGLRSLNERYSEILFGPLVLALFDAHCGRVLERKEAQKAQTRLHEEG